MPTGRFAPSPTGPLHLGSLRTALLAWLFARSTGSAFLVRIEDLDLTAARPEIEAQQLHDLTAIGLDWDGEVVRQRDRLHHYAKAIDGLVAGGQTYPCFCSRREVREASSAPHGIDPLGLYPGTCRDISASERGRQTASGRPAALRLRANGAEVTFVDRLHGEVTSMVDDFVIRRNDGTPAYNLAVVIDDAAQGVGEVVRGDDLLPTTGRQVLVAGMLGLPPVVYAHVPLVIGADGLRLAKRDGAITLADRVALGDTPEEVCGALAASLGLIDDVSPSAPADLLVRFDPTRLPRIAWRFEG